MSVLPRTFDEWLKLLSAAGALGTFFWGVWVWQDQSRRSLEQQRLEAARNAETRRIESTRPFLERQLKLYTEATQIASAIATTKDSPERSKALQRFWQLYYGELALVENKEVEAAMVRLGRALQSGASAELLRGLSLQLAHRCRESLDRSWGVQAWSSPDLAAAIQEAQ
jgi:hypothetical protein